jgi:hypothetical protein
MSQVHALQEVHLRKPRQANKIQNFQRAMVEQKRTQQKRTDPHPSHAKDAQACGTTI